MIRQQLFIGGALIAGVAIGFFVRPEAEKSATEGASAEKSAAVAPIQDRGEAATVEALRARVRSLEAQLASALKRPAEAVPPNGPQAKGGEPGRGPRNPREFLEKMAKEDPVRFAKMTNSFERMRRDRQQRAEAKASYLSSIDTSHLSAAAKKTHDAYQELLAEREELMEKMHNPDLSDDERHQLMDEMRKLGDNLRKTGSDERKVLLNEVAREVGLEGDAAGELIETVQDIVEATDNRMHMGPPPPRQ